MTAAFLVATGRCSLLCADPGIRADSASLAVIEGAPSSRLAVAHYVRSLSGEASGDRGGRVGLALWRLGDGVPPVLVADVPCEQLGLCESWDAHSLRASAGVVLVRGSDSVKVIEVSDTAHVRTASELGAQGVNDLAVRLDAVFVAAPSGVRIVDVSDPSAPRTLSTIEGDFASIVAQSAMLYAYGGSSVSVFDTKDPARPRLLSVASVGDGGQRHLAVRDGHFEPVVAKALYADGTQEITLGSRGLCVRAVETLSSSSHASSVNRTAEASVVDKYLPYWALSAVPGALLGAAVLAVLIHRHRAWAREYDARRRAHEAKQERERQAKEEKKRRERVAQEEKERKEREERERREEELRQKREREERERQERLREQRRREEEQERLRQAGIARAREAIRAARQTRILESIDLSRTVFDNMVLDLFTDLVRTARFLRTVDLTDATIPDSMRQQVQSTLEQSESIRTVRGFRVRSRAELVAIAKKALQERVYREVMERKKRSGELERQKAQLIRQFRSNGKMEQIKANAVRKMKSTGEYDRMRASLKAKMVADRIAEMRRTGEMRAVVQRAKATMARNGTLDAIKQRVKNQRLAEARQRLAAQRMARQQARAMQRQQMMMIRAQQRAMQQQMAWEQGYDYYDNGDDGQADYMFHQQEMQEEAQFAQMEQAEELQADSWAQQAAEQQANEQAEQQAEAEAQSAAQAQAEAQAEAEAERLAEQQAEQQAQEQAEQQAEAQAAQQAEAEATHQAEAEAEHQAEEEARHQAEAEAERQAELEAEREAARQAEIEAERHAQEEAERQAQAEAERQAQIEAERHAQEEAERQAQQEAEQQAQEEAQRRAQEQADGNQSLYDKGKSILSRMFGDEAGDQQGGADDAPGDGFVERGKKWLHEVVDSKVDEPLQEQMPTDAHENHLTNLQFIGNALVPGGMASNLIDVTFDAVDHNFVEILDP
eukprot:m51a1_g14289 hypothetical protein (950) ;mRNA; r:399147-402950